MIKIASWNVNSLRVRLEQVLTYLNKHQPDVLALQETKLIDDVFPDEEVKEAGYQAVYSGQKTYNGVAILSRQKPTDIITDFPTLNDPERRVLAATFGEIRVLNIYVPNGQTVGSNKYEYKLNWLKHLLRYVEQQLKEFSNLIILGDFNIAPEDRDVYDPIIWEGSVLVSEAERQAFADLLALGFTDIFRQHHKEPELFSWWDYRRGSFSRNLGVRIDHILASSPLTTKSINCTIDKTMRQFERPSDHAPILGEFAE